MYQTIFKTQWDFMRWFRLFVGTALVVSGIFYNDNVFNMLGGFFIFQSLFNVSCCGYNNCSVKPVESKNTMNSEAIEYEEINSK
jgi:hypothetical protein